MKHLVISTALIFSSMCVFAQAENTKSVVNALQAGDAKALVALCIPNLDLTVMGKDDVYSKAQAEQILKKFFEANTPSSFTTEHDGDSKMGDHYVIGTLTTSTGNHRVTFFQKKEGDTFLVKQLRIEASR